MKEKDALSRNCQTFAKSSGDFVGSQVVSTLPVETLVSASLSYSRILRIGTPDGLAWKIDGDKITNIDFDMAGTDGFAARALAGFDENCELMATDAAHPPDKPLTVNIDSVISSTEGKNFEPKTPKDAKVEAIMCGRDDFFLAPNDFKVLKAGIVLYIVDKGKGHPERMGALEISGGEVRFRSIKGDRPTTEQLTNIQSRLNTFNSSS